FARLGKSAKVACVDFDNTLWGGVVGEVGLGNLVIGDEGIGLAFVDFQRELLKLRDCGILLAGCSKNNLDDAVQVFEQHPSMALRLNGFPGVRINWNDTAANLVGLADELSLSLDSFVCLDDNPAER